MRLGMISGTNGIERGSLPDLFSKYTIWSEFGAPLTTVARSTATSSSSSSRIVPERRSRAASV
jgi:hypothetical protein